MITAALAENGARRIYVVGRRMDKLLEVAAKYPGQVAFWPLTLACLR